MLTNKKRLYAEARLSGLNQKDSAIAAGYSAATADQSASRLEKDPDVIAHRNRVAGPVTDSVVPEPAAKKQEPEPVTASQGQDLRPPQHEKQPKMSLYFEDPLEFLRHVTNDTAEDPRLRVDAAKAWASYTVPKPGEKGKKEEKADAAKKVASRFATAAAPLKAVK